MVDETEISTLFIRTASRTSPWAWNGTSWEDLSHCQLRFLVSIAKAGYTPRSVGYWSSEGWVVFALCFDELV